LIERLRQGLQRKLTLISAPPGFGKTTLISAWIASFASNASDTAIETPAGSQVDHPRFAWVTLDAQDNDPVRFWSYVFTALDSVQVDFSAEALVLLQAPQAPPLKLP
jgi:LuxR family maltose regulon positive regulatory protein